MTKYSKKENWNIAEDPIITSIDEHEKKLKFAIWDQMEFFSEEIGIDDPAMVIREINDSLSGYYLEHASEYEDIDEDSKEGDSDTIDILEHEKKLKLAVWCHMEFLVGDVGLDYDKVIDMIDESIEKYIREYSPMGELF